MLLLPALVSGQCTTLNLTFNNTVTFQKNEMLDFPPGGFSTFEEVCTDLSVLPKLIPSELEWVPVVHVVPVAVGGAVAASVCGLGCGVCVLGFAGGAAGTSPPKEIELPPPGGRITLQKEVH